MLYFKNNSEVFTGIMKRLKKSIGDRVKKVGTFFNLN